MATSIKYEICIFWFGQIGRAGRQVLDLPTSGLPYERRNLVHQELSERFTRACKIQEVDRVDVCGNLIPSRQSANGRERNVHARGTAHQGSIGIVHLAFHDTASWVPPYLPVEAFWRGSGHHPRDVRRCGLSLISSAPSLKFGKRGH